MAAISIANDGGSASRGMGSRYALRIRRWAIMGFIIAAVTWIGVTWGMPVYLHGRLLYWQHECLAFSDSTGQPAFHYDPLLAFGFQHAETPDYDNDQDGPNGPIPDDQCPDVMPPHIAPFGGRGDPQCLQMFNRRLNFVLFDYFQPVFMHELKTPAGESRLVIISISPPDGHALFAPPLVQALVMRPAGLTNQPQITTMRLTKLQDPMFTMVPSTFTWGGVDASDPSRFHIPYRQGNTQYQLDGHLGADGAAVIDESP